MVKNGLKMVFSLILDGLKMVFFPISDGLFLLEPVGTYVLELIGHKFMQF